MRPRRALGLFCLILALASLAVPRPARAQQVVDLDRDGRADRISTSATDPTAIRIWLSGTRSVRVLHAGRPIFRVRAIDLDGDGRPELVAADASCGLSVWRDEDGRGQYRLVRPHRVRPQLLVESSVPAVHGDGVSDGGVLAPRPGPTGATSLAAGSRLSAAPAGRRFPAPWPFILPAAAVLATGAPRAPPPPSRALV